MRGRVVWEWVRSVVVVVIIVMVVRTFIVAPMVVEGHSMLPTLADDERLFVNKVGYRLGDPERFDVIVFETEDNIDYVKRIIGVPGDTIYYKDDEFLLNGSRVYEDYLTEGVITGRFELVDVVGSEKVPEGYYFVLGDNRERSLDSRHFGLVDEDDIVGRVDRVIGNVD